MAAIIKIKESCRNRALSRRYFLIFGGRLSSSRRVLFAAVTSSTCLLVKALDSSIQEVLLSFL
jgi:hypothetical protein